MRVFCISVLGFLFLFPLLLRLLTAAPASQFLFACARLGLEELVKFKRNVQFDAGNYTVVVPNGGGDTALVTMDLGGEGQESRTRSANPPHPPPPPNLDSELLNDLWARTYGHIDSSLSHCATTLLDAVCDCTPHHISCPKR